MFTINLAVVSRILLTFFSEAGKFPHVDDSHWRLRIGFLLPERRDVWWRIESSTNDDELAGEVESALGLALPEVRNLDDERLRDLWVAGTSPGLTELQRLMYLSVLLEEIGPRDELSSVLGRLREMDKNGLKSVTIRQHLERIGANSS